MSHFLIHRGLAKKKFIENTISSFKYCFDRNYGVETDIHATKDTKFICFHDFTLTRVFKKKLSVKNLSYSKIKEISTKFKKPIPLLKDVLKSSKNKCPIFIEIKPIFSISLLKKLIKETSKFTKCVFISYKHENIHNLIRIKKNIKIGFSFAPRTSVKKILKKANNKNINCLILDKSYLKNKKIQNLKNKKYFYTIKTKLDFNKYKKNNNLIFENL